MKQYLDIMGYEVKDKVTGFEGVVTSVSFDLYGCIQCVVTPKLNKDGKKEDSHWFDYHRLEVTGAERVMPMPAFAVKVIEHAKGPEAKPPRAF